MEDVGRWEKAGISRVIKTISAPTVGQETSHVGCTDEGMSYFGRGRYLYICLVSPLWLEKGTLVLRMTLILHASEAQFFFFLFFFLARREQPG